jgi:hypothetical protein
MKKKKTLFVNLLAGPGAGKSTTAAKVFGRLKDLDINCELIQEFAKDLTWEESHLQLSDQLYVSGQQHFRQHRLDGKVTVAVTDSPLIVGLLYFNEKDCFLKQNFERYIAGLFLRQNNANYFIERRKKYNPKGRNQTKAQAIQKDSLCKNLLDRFEVPYTMIEGTKTVGDTSAEDFIVADILKRI